MEKKILNKLEELREEMVKFASKYGVDHPKVLEISKKIDKLHNQLNQIKKESTYKQVNNTENDKLYEWDYAVMYA